MLCGERSIMCKHKAKVPLSSTPAPRMVSGTKATSVSLIHAARLEASRNVSKWRWTLLGVIISILPIVNIVLFGVSTIVLSALTPTIDLSTLKRQERYFQNPARYTGEYRRTAKRLRCLRTFYGWLAGIIIFNLF